MDTGMPAPCERVGLIFVQHCEQHGILNPADDTQAASSDTAWRGRPCHFFHSRAVNMAAELRSLQLPNPQNPPSPGPKCPWLIKRM